MLGALESPKARSGGRLMEMGNHRCKSSGAETLKRPDAAPVPVAATRHGIRGADLGRIGELAERLQAHRYGLVALVDRCE